MGGVVRKQTAEGSEGSFVFSLAELSRMEEERRQTELEAVRLQREAMARAQVEADERRREGERRAAREEEEARDRARLRERETEAKIAAEHAAAVEAAKVAAEMRARGEDAEKARAHELAMERAQVARSTAKAKSAVLGALLGAVLVAAASIGVQVGVIAPRQRAELALADESAEQATTTIRDLQKRLDETNERAASAEKDARAARAQADELQTELATAQKEAARKVPSWQAPAKVGSTTVSVPATTSHDLDGTSVCSGPDDPDPSCVHHG